MSEGDVTVAGRRQGSGVCVVEMHRPTYSELTCTHAPQHDIQHLLCNSVMPWGSSGIEPNRSYTSCKLWHLPQSHRAAASGHNHATPCKSLTRATTQVSNLGHMRVWYVVNNFACCCADEAQAGIGSADKQLVTAPKESMHCLHALLHQDFGVFLLLVPAWCNSSR
jgi:hypothetical protein